MKGLARWRDSEHRQRAIERAGGPEAFQQGVQRLADEARAWRLAEMRKDRGLTQQEVADRMGVTKGRVSQIEAGQVSGHEVIARYVEALGGNLMMMAVFSDGELREVG
ncbi:helix-turn-helix domain-containing protein [Allostreptomyces psammosilenae]|uniref:DNA-binding XRE family transcriptional regulator n=1 Tax=Allostreptomyces psammosilenae TaxID=1892865 RepID=A0A853AC86_9ACTN|nr:helix-turn-helix transcriptional regulator [Allostreptomyces psammosilenae]NYI07982.1 DNA-binding XRE family transcriptional regulator [Allostreptomyces psammosilenae]